ncbi:efflux RND transporter periplasmic adaptor subunit [Simplicispira psychrophila]|uniref:efflux RND transporter periplasmic adaptor subunit n=1 Tax=Simplicispira psychrophila TaxID=80882 RepID=UPI00056D2BE7|nr:efflux RND transporter periplasmic adaptor subunit [Simplicispira psychrophila]
MLKFHPLTLAAVLLLPLAAVAAPDSAAMPAQVSTVQGRSGFDGVVEAVRQTTLAAQVPGAVVELVVKVGERVQAGQLLLRLDARSADQSAAASDAQVQAARASLEVATREYTRQQKLRDKQYISQAALDQAEAQFKATRAQVAAQVAQAGAARTQTGLHTVRAPYAGVVSEVPVQLGDMAMPGRALVTLYDPSTLRVTASVPQSLLGAAQGAPSEAVRVELPGLATEKQWPTAARVQVLPTVDAATHTVQVRADLAKGLEGVAPGMFARLWLPLVSQSAAAASRRVAVPLSAVVRRAEMTGVYVQGEGGKPLLRQVRLGRVEGDQVEVLTGVAPGESVVVDAQAATRAKAQ